MQLRNFFGGCRPCAYHLLSFHSLVMEVTRNIGELRIYSMNLYYLNKEFSELRISFRIGNTLTCSDIFDYESDIIITFSDTTTKEDLEKYITNKIVVRFTMKDGIICSKRLESFEYIKNFNSQDKIKD